jgi:hypothetical protein
VLALVGGYGCKEPPQESDFSVVLHRRAIEAAHSLGQGRPLTENELADTRARCSRCSACAEMCVDLEASLAPKPDLARPSERHERSFVDPPNGTP